MHDRTIAFASATATSVNVAILAPVVVAHLLFVTFWATIALIGIPIAAARRATRTVLVSAVMATRTTLRTTVANIAHVFAWGYMTGSTHIRVKIRGFVDNHVWRNVILRDSIPTDIITV